jgi:putative membrane protein
MMTGMLGMVMWLMMGLMLLGLATGSIAWVRRRLKGRPASPQARHEGETPQEVLRRRYAAGEIDHDEYLRRQHDLTETEH